MKKQIYLLLSIVIILFSCSSAAYKSTIKDNGKQIPPNFGLEKTIILLMEKGSSGYNSHLEENWDKYYTGKYEIVTKETLNNKKYADTKKYKYIFDYDIRVTRGNDGSGRQQTYEGYSFFLIDREDNKKFGSFLDSQAWNKLMKAYIMKLEEVRLKNEDGKK